MFLPEQDREYLIEKKLSFQEVIDQGQKGLIIDGWVLPLGKYNYESIKLLLLLPPGYPDAPPDMFYVFPALLLMPANRPARAADATHPFNGIVWQRWSRHFNPAEWRSGGVDGIRSFLKKVEEALRIAE